MITPVERLRELLEEAYRIVDQIEEPEAVVRESRTTGQDQTVRESRTVQPAPTRAAKPDRVLRRGEASYTGKLGRPAFRQTKNGTPLWTAGLGIDQGDGQLQWMKLQAWKKIAETADTNFEPGDVVTVIGKPGTSQYTDTTGVIIKTEVLIVSSIDWAE